MGKKEQQKGWFDPRRVSVKTETKKKKPKGRDYILGDSRLP